MFFIDPKLIMSTTKPSSCNQVLNYEINYKDKLYNWVTYDSIRTTLMDIKIEAILIFLKNSRVLILM